MARTLAAVRTDTRRRSSMMRGSRFVNRIPSLSTMSTSGAVAPVEHSVIVVERRGRGGGKKNEDTFAQFFFYFWSKLEEKNAI